MARSTPLRGEIQLCVGQRLVVQRDRPGDREQRHVRFLIRAVAAGKDDEDRARPGPRAGRSWDWT